jgi:hypothetical protein
LPYWSKQESIKEGQFPARASENFTGRVMQLAGLPLSMPNLNLVIATRAVAR